MDETLFQPHLHSFSCKFTFKPHILLPSLLQHSSMFWQLLSHAWPAWLAALWWQGNQLLDHLRSFGGRAGEVGRCAPERDSSYSTELYRRALWLQLVEVEGPKQTEKVVSEVYVHFICACVCICVVFFKCLYLVLLEVFWKVFTLWLAVQFWSLQCCYPLTSTYGHAWLVMAGWRGEQQSTGGQWPRMIPAASAT